MIKQAENVNINYEQIHNFSQNIKYLQKLKSKFVIYKDNFLKQSIIQSVLEHCGF